MRFSEAKGRKVVSTSTAETVAVVDGFVVDPGRRSVLALHLRKSQSGDTLRWSDLNAFGADAVTVAGTDALSEAGEDVEALRGKAHDVLGKRVLSASGDELGSVVDVEFDPASGSLVALVLGETEVDASRLVGVGSYAVVVASG